MFYTSGEFLLSDKMLLRIHTGARLRRKKTGSPGCDNYAKVPSHKGQGFFIFEQITGKINCRWSFADLVPIDIVVPFTFALSRTNTMVPTGCRLPV
jgi:hypothetical protein